MRSWNRKISVVTNAERVVAAVEASGFTARQARCLVLVVEYSRVCLPRQYRTFAGIGHGRQTHRFFDKVVRSGFARMDWPAPPAAFVEYVHLDALGSVRAVTGELGTVLARHDFLPFGEEWTGVPSRETRLFTGQERDAATGLDYFGARYYRADIARFTTVDPELNIKDTLVDPQRWNRYAYVTNIP